MLTEQRPERTHRSGDIQKGKLPIVLENQFCSGTCIYIENNVILDVFFGLRIYIYIFAYSCLNNWFQLPFYSLHPQAPDHIYNEILNLKQKWEKCTARKATPDKVFFVSGFHAISLISV